MRLASRPTATALQCPSSFPTARTAIGSDTASGSVRSGQELIRFGGYDKADDTNKKRQTKEIEEARARLRRWKTRQQQDPVAP